MGRKNKTKNNVSDKHNGLSKSQKRELTDIICQLLEICRKPSTGGPKDWDEYLEIHDCVEKIRKYQEGHTLPSYERDEHVESFMAWIGNNVTSDSVKIRRFGNGGDGLQATRDLPCQSLFLTIPRKVMMTTESAQLSSLGALIPQDNILKVMPNVVLALHVLCEQANPDSFWLPYIKILPNTFSTPLYFSPEELQLLKGSQAFYEALSQYKNIARQYAYFHKLFQSNPTAKMLPIHTNFCYDDYRRAVSVVMTRQNQIPSCEDHQMINALIPLWDMCNHSNGQFTTDFSLEKDCSECYALQDYKEGDQIYIFYGNRSNSEFLIHSGFVYPDNEHDRLPLKLGIAKSDQLFLLKSAILNKCGIPVSHTFDLVTGPNPVKKELLIFLRILCMKEDDLKLCEDKNAIDLVEDLGSLHSSYSKEDDMKMWSYLETRAALLARSYPTDIECDQARLAGSDLSECGRLAVQLVLGEKTILKNTTRFAAEQKLKLAEVKTQDLPA
ncbi:actin-histidine N-methyltransferase-like isoform X2 [Lineus longissimus]|uniref:actin-histidine N-methyltransferase-like isoform X2 n=1 Tax=Lineus longissimus TaxID=88925 RepID=UPI002B4CD0BD